MDLMLKAQQFLAEEQELLADFALDMENYDGGKEYTKLAALWAMQTARVEAIKDVFEVLEIPVEENPAEYEADKYLYEETQLNAMSDDELVNLLMEHGYDVSDFEDKACRVDVLSRLVEC